MLARRITESAAIPGCVTPGGSQRDVCWCSDPENFSFLGKALEAMSAEAFEAKSRAR
jgi:hypothetical protein